MTTELPESLAQAGLPADNLLARRDALPSPVRALHRQVLAAFAGTGQPPRAEQLTSWAQELQLDLAEALGTLASAELVFLARPGGQVTGGVPFAAGPTAHQVRIAGGPTVSANCAVDALGIGAMLDRDSDVTSRDPYGGETVTASHRDGQWTWQPPGAVVFLGSSGQGRLTDTCCPVINFFTTADNARAYQDRHGLTGVVLPFTEAAAAGALYFADLMTGPTHP